MLEKLKFWTKSNNLKIDSQKNTSDDVSFKGVLNECSIKKYAVPNPPKEVESKMTDIPSYYFPNINKNEDVEKYAVPPAPMYAVPDEPPMLKYAIPTQDKKEPPMLKYAIPRS